MRMLAFLSPHFQLMYEHEKRQKDKVFVVPSLICGEYEYTLGKKNEYTYKKTVRTHRLYAGEKKDKRKTPSFQGFFFFFFNYYYFSLP